MYPISSIIIDSDLKANFRIEEKCIADGMNMPQKSAVMDSLARWVKIQKQSLYIRMKTYKDRKASGLISPQKTTPTSTPASSTNKNTTPGMPTLSAATKVSNSEKAEVKSPRTDKPTNLTSTPVVSRQSSQNSASATEGKSEKVSHITSTNSDDFPL